MLAGPAVASWKPAVVHATVTPPGTITTYAGSSGFGPATNVPQEPFGLAVSGTTLYVGDFSAHIVRALDLTTGSQTIVAGTGDPAATGDGGPATAAGIGYPEQLAVDASGNLYIAASERIRKVTPGGIITTVAGGGSGGLGDGGPATSATLLAAGVTLNAAGDIFIADSGHNRVRKVDHTTHIITTVAGDGLQSFYGDGGPATLAELNSPEGVAVDGTGKLWIADAGNNRVRAVDPVTHKINTVAGTGSNAHTCDTGPDLGFPTGLWFDNGGLLYITSADGCVQTLQGGVMTVFAGCLFCTPDDDQAPLQTRLYASETGVGDAAGDFFIADTGAKKVRELPAGQNVLHTIAGTGTQCAKTMSGAATDAYLCRPQGVAIDGGGNLFIADGLGEVVDKVAPDGTISVVAGNGTYGYSGDGGNATAAQLLGPSGVAVDGAGTLFISEGGHIRKVSGGIITTLAAIQQPSGIAVTPSGDLVVSDSYVSRIYRVTPAGVVSTLAGTGTNGFSGDGGLAINAQLSIPGGVAVDAAGNVYVDDTGNERLRKIDTGGVITTVAGLANVSQFWPGSGVAVGPGGQVVVAGAYNPSVLLVSPNGIVQTIAGSTTLGFAGDGGPAANALFYQPSGVAFDSLGNLFVGDGGNHRVRRIESFGATSAPTNLKATPGFDSARVRWTPPVNGTGLPVVQYTVTAYVGASPAATVTVTGNPAPASAVFANLVPGTQYTFKVVASNAWLFSPPSQPSPAITVLAHPARGTIATWAGKPGSGAAKFVGQLPYAIGINGVHVYVGDLGTAVIRDLNTQTSQESILAGNAAIGFSGDGGKAVNAMLSGSTAIAVCGGNTYFDDTLNYVIRKIDPNGVVTPFAGVGEDGYSGDGGPAKLARISRVLGLACRTGGGLYVSDSDNGRVRIIDAAGKIDTWWSGFSFPTGITEMGAANLVAVSDSGDDNAVWKLSNTDAVLLAGTPGAAGDDVGAVHDYASHLNDPRGLAWNSGEGLMVADSGNNRIKQVQQGWVYQMAGTGVAGFSGDGVSFQVELNEPTDIQWLSNGYRLIVADTGNNRVRDINMSGGPFMTTIAGNGTPSRSGDAGSSIDAQVGNPYAVAVDAAGNQYVADDLNNVIRKIDVNGEITTVAGTGVAGYVGDSGPATSAELNDPRGVAVASDGSLYISDTGNQVIRKVDPAGNISTYAGNGVAGYTGDGVLATSTRINSPRAVAVAPNGDLYIADTANNRVRKVDHASHMIVTVAGDGVGRFNGDNQLATLASLKGPRGVAFDAAGALYIGDSDNNRVRKVDAGVITTVAGTGTAGARGDGRQATSAELDFPFGLAFDGAGDLYIADSGNSRVRLVTPSGKISTVVGACGPGFGGDWEPAFSALINFPFGLGVDSNGTIYIADSSSNRVRIVYGLDTARTASCQSAGGGVPGSRTSHASGPTAPPSIRIEQTGVGSPPTALAAFDAPHVAGPAPAAPVRVAHTHGRTTPVTHPAGSGATRGPVVWTPKRMAPAPAGPAAAAHDTLVPGAGGGPSPYLLAGLVAVPLIIGAIAATIRVRVSGRRRADRRSAR